MNIFELDQKSAAEKPHFVHLRGFDGKLLYIPKDDNTDDTDKPIGVEIVGAHSSLGTKYRNKRAARIVINQKKNKGADLSEEDLIALLAENTETNEGEIADICVGWRNFCDSNGPRDFSRSELRDLLRRNPTLAEQIEAAHTTAANFLG